MISHILLYKSKRISVYCTPAVNRDLSRRHKTFVKAAIAAEKTIIRNISRKYPSTKDIHYNFLFKNYKTEDMLGSCDLEYDNDVIIDLNAKQHSETLYTTIAHELVHARQFLSGQLMYNTRIKYFTYEGDKHRYIYRRQPWEIEAYALQDNEALKLKRWLLDNVNYNPKLAIPKVSS
jgi:hypothetical protein